MDAQLEEYLRKRRGPVGLEEGDVESADPGDMDRSLSPEPLALRERPRFDSLMAGLDAPRLQAEADVALERGAADDVADMAGRRLGRDGVPLEAGDVAASARKALLAGRGLSASADEDGSGGPAGYLEALRKAQKRDDFSAALARLGNAGEQFGEVASRGAYKANPLPPMPSEVSKEEKRRQVVLDYLKQQRESEDSAQNNAFKRWMMERQAQPKPTPPVKPGMTQEQFNEKLEAEIDRLRADAEAKRRPPTARGGAAPRTAAPKGLPASEVKEMADFDVATEQLDKLLTTFDSLDMGGVAGKVGGKATDWMGLQGTDSAAYLADARRTMQAVGTILEGGKLAAGDEVKYRRMLPEPGDPLELAKKKVEGLKQLLSSLRAKREQRFRASGFSDSAAQAPAGKVAVSNGSETLYIDPQDVPDAAKDGYKVVKP